MMRRWINLIESSSNMIRVYHAQFHKWPGVLSNREIKGYNSMGTWFTSSLNVATELYGDKVGVYEIPQGNWLELGSEPVGTSLGHCYPLIAQHLGQDVEAELQHTPWTEKARARQKELRKKEEYLMPQERKEHARLRKSEEITRQALNHPGYCQDFRGMITQSGYRGIVWRDVHWDGSTEKSDIYLVFHTEDIRPVEQFASNRSVNSDETN